MHGTGCLIKQYSAADFKNGNTHHCDFPEKAWKFEFPYTFVQGISQQKKSGKPATARTFSCLCNMIL